MVELVSIWGDRLHVPLAVYLSQDTSAGLKPAMLICPGGAYREHAVHEGREYAEWLTKHGIHCFVLEYRLGSQGHRYPKPFEDVVRAIKFIRHNASSWGIDPSRVGIMGSSAGGHLASTLMTHFDEGIPDASGALESQSARPDIGVLCYPVISMQSEPHLVSRANLLGDPADASLVQFLSNEDHVSAHVPPCFIWHTFADQAVKVSHSLAFASALNRVGVPFELHTFQTGRHGLGLNTTHSWAENCLAWLKVQGFIQ